MSKKRLLDLIFSCERVDLPLPRDYQEHLADFLLANGVIVAPMPMAEWLREELTEYVHKRCMEEL